MSYNKKIKKEKKNKENEYCASKTRLASVSERDEYIVRDGNPVMRSEPKVWYLCQL